MFNIFTKEGLVIFLYTLPALLLSLSIYKFAQAWTAYKLGDSSQKLRGRLTLDPFKHVDPIGLIFIAILGIGWGKPVTMDDRNFKDKAKGTMLTAIAGPIATFLMAIFLTFVLKGLIMVGVLNLTDTNNVVNILVQMLIMTIQFNVVFAIFNMIPIPPFDGAKVLFYFLPKKLRWISYKIERYSFIIFLILVFTDIVAYIIAPAYSLVFKLIEWILYL